MHNLSSAPKRLFDFTLPGLQVHVLMCLLDVASGMTYLHSMGILHGDLKSANVLLKSTATDLRGFQCKIADFGCAKCRRVVS